ncbi:MAG: hypothetical protein Q4A61_05585 [Porphyromonadaceae bacterium]|nr:hypothetical protein [Porphyromonadaceae bacterium]
MKTRTFILTMLAILASIALNSCSKQDDPSKQQGEHTYYFDHIFDAVLVPRRLKLLTFTHPTYDKELNTPRTKLFLRIEGDSHGKQIDGSAREPLKKFRERIGDRPRTNHYFGTYPGGFKALHQGIEALQVEAVEDYNANYRTGSNLSSIVEVTYASFDASFKRLISSDNGNLNQIAKRYKRMLSDGISECKLPTPLDIMLDFKEAPKMPKVKLRFVLSLEDGSTLELVSEQEIKEAR